MTGDMQAAGLREWQCDGVTLAGGQWGDGGPPILFVHGWCCDRSFLSAQVAHFAKRHRVVSVDLRGHGRSSGAGDDCSLERHAADLDAVIEQSGLDRPIVVGHSMGGVIALELSVRRPERVRGIAMFDSIVAASPDLQAAAQGLGMLLDSPRYRETVAEFVQQYLLRPEPDAALCERVLRTMCGTDPRVVLAGWQSMVDYDDRAALKACTAPILFTGVECTVAGLGELPDLNPGLELVHMSGVSHFHPVEAADETNAHLERFIDRLR